MRLLDLFCGAGMASDGYYKAGFDEIVGLDINPQPDYPYEFKQMDAREFMERVGYHTIEQSFDAIHASPPCQLFTRASHLRDAQGGKTQATDMLTPILQWAMFLRVPFIIENVEGAKKIMPPKDTIRLCGSSFGLQVQRHRMFWNNQRLVGLDCNHSKFPLDPISNKPRPWGVYHVPNDNIPSGGRTVRNVEQGREVMGVEREIPWASLKEGFPPVYTEYLGKQLLERL